MRFTAVIVTWNSEEEIARPGRKRSSATCRTAASCCSSTTRRSDGTVKAIRRLSPCSRVIELQENIGFGPANNVGVRAAESEVVALLNPDALVVDDSLCALAQLAASQRGLFCPRPASTATDRSRCRRGPR